MEVAAILCVLAITLTIAMPRFAAMRDVVAVQGASRSVVQALMDARRTAMRLGTRCAVKIDSAGGFISVHVQSDTVGRVLLHDLFGVSLWSSRDSIAYAPSGLGVGLANATIVVSRGSSSDTVSVSRTGRVKR